MLGQVGFFAWGGVKSLASDLEVVTGAVPSQGARSVHVHFVDNSRVVESDSLQTKKYDNWAEYRDNVVVFYLPLAVMGRRLTSA